MNQVSFLSSRTLHVVGPSVAIFVLYLLLFHISIGRQYKQEQVKLTKLESATMLADLESANQQLTSLQSEAEKLNEHLQTVRRNHQTLVARQAPANRELEGLSSPAKAIANLVELLEQNGLVCMSSALVSNGRSAQKDPTSGSSATALRSTEVDKREIKLSVFGSFDQIRSALNQLRLTPQICLRSLEMDESDGLNTTRSWILTVDTLEGVR
jgi:ribosomal protein S15P/S13E